MTIEPVFLYEISCTPWNKDFPIKQMKIYIQAKSIEEAQRKAMDYDWKFFDEDMSRSISILLGEYIKKSKSQQNMQDLKQ